MSRILKAMIVTPMLLLICSSFTFASKIMIAKAALSAGLLPFQLGLSGNFGAAILLFLLVRIHSEKIPTTRRHLALYTSLALISFAAPTVLSYAVVDRVGPAYTSTVYSLSPILTMSFAAGLGVERMFVRRAIGILIGFVGMIALVQQQLTLIDTEQTLWILLGLLIPAFAALGNIVRTRFWPEGTSAQAFACATLLASCLIILVMAPMFEDVTQWRLTSYSDWGWTIGMIAILALLYVLNFQLQKIAGPVIFSQIGYWGTGFGVVLSALLFGDLLSGLALLGLCMIICGGLIARKPASQ